MRGYLLDTNHMSAAIRRRSPIRQRLEESHRQGWSLGTCWPVLCELEFGIVQTRDPPGCRRILKGLLRQVKVWPFTWEVVDAYAKISLELRDRGRVLSHVDAVLAALAQQMNTTILTTDRDFEALPEIRTENWLS